MQTGRSRALPSEDSSTSPRARGPLVFFALRATCAGALCATLKPSSAQMTIPQALRYNHDRIGEATMLDVNDKAPAITLEDENGKEVSLKDFRERRWFYSSIPGPTLPDVR